MQFTALLLYVLFASAYCKPSAHGLNNDRAWFGMVQEDVERDLTTDGLIKHWGYVVESYDVTTEDGYTLTIFRIPRPKNATENPPSPRPVVMIQHGLLGSSDMWVSNLPTEDAAFLYADAGYDVWIGNFRGNKYGKKHKTLSLDAYADKGKFWDFSWPEMAEYDLPAMINFILEKTNAPNLYYIGHSMGTLTAFVKFSTDLEIGKKVKKFYALAPVMQLGHMKGAMQLMSKFTISLTLGLSAVGMEEFLPPMWLMKELSQYACAGQISGSLLCGNILFLIAGPSSNQLNSSRIPVYMSNTPAGTSRRTFSHFGQMVQSGKLQSYDFGMFENKRRYGSLNPPVYDVSRMETPVGLYVGSVDWLATPEDVNDMRPKLKNVFAYQLLKDFNHLDFLWGLRTASEVYLPIAKDIRDDFSANNEKNDGGKTK